MPRSSSRQKLLRELRIATRQADWPRIHRLRAVLDELPLRDELAIAVAAHDRPGDDYMLTASRWLIRVLVEREPTLGRLYAISQLATLLQRLDQPAARMQLAGLLQARAGIDAREILGIPIPPPPDLHEHLPDYIDRLRQIGMLDAFCAYERAQQDAYSVSRAREAV